MNDKQDAYITGIGLLTCLGKDISEVWNRLMKNESGLKPIHLFDVKEARGHMGGEITGDYPLMGKERMAAFTKQAVMSAVQDAGLTAKEINDCKSMLIIGTSLGHIFNNQDGPVELDDFIPEVLDDMGLEIPYLLVSSACSSGGDAIAAAADMLEFHGYDMIICGGTDILDNYKQMGHSSLRTLSAEQCRPFSDENYGTTLGEGAAYIVMQNERRPCNKNVYAKLIGRGNTTDNVSVTNPDETGDGAVQAVRNALYRTGYHAEDIAYINAHGSGTQINDRMERTVYERLFMSSKPFLSSVKGAFGHMLGAAGAVEAVIAILSVFKKEAPPTTSCRHPSEDWEGTRLVVDKGVRLTKEPLISISVTYGFGGANSCLVFREITSN